MYIVVMTLKILSLWRLRSLRCLGRSSKRCRNAAEAVGQSDLLNITYESLILSKRAEMECENWVLMGAGKKADGSRGTQT
jgi:hypothetical protein